MDDKLKNWPRTRLFEYQNSQGDVLAITYLGNNKFPSICFKKVDSNTYESIGFLRDPDRFVEFWKNSHKPFN